MHSADLGLKKAQHSNFVSSPGLSTLLHRQSSLMSIASLPPPTTPAPILNLNALSTPATHNPDYINTNMEEHSWYVGEIDRDAAIQQLDEYPVSTFLVRCRVQHGERVGYALSLKTTPEDVKHMKICTQNTAEGNWFYLSDTRKFRSIVELVSYFSRNSLKESFSGLDITLRFSVGELSIVEALFDFNDKEKNMLPMRVGERVTIIDKSGDSQGWWKACSNMKVGFIPKDYVQTIQPESVAMAITPTLETCSSLDTASTRDTGSTSAPSVADQSASQLDTSAVELATAAAAS